MSVLARASVCINELDVSEPLFSFRKSLISFIYSRSTLSSYRFLETLQYGCIPVITTNDDELIILPFSEIIDWSKSVIIYSNSSLSLLPYYLKMISINQRNEMQKECVNIWLKYFSSIQRIVLTLLDILNERFISFFSS